MNKRSERVLKLKARAETLQEAVRQGYQWKARAERAEGKLTALRSYHKPVGDFCAIVTGDGMPMLDGECGVCAILDCHKGDPMHYHHDGCPSCEYETERSADGDAEGVQRERDGESVERN